MTEFWYSPVLSRQTVTVTGLCRIVTTVRDVVMGLDERRETDGSLGMIFQVLIKTSGNTHKRALLGTLDLS